MVTYKSFQDGNLKLKLSDYQQIRKKLTKYSNFGWNHFRKSEGGFKTEGRNFIVIEYRQGEIFKLYYIQKADFVK